MQKEYEIILKEVLKFKGINGKLEFDLYLKRKTEEDCEELLLFSYTYTKKFSKIYRSISEIKNNWEWLNIILFFID